MKNEPVCGFRDAFVAAVVASVREERGVQLLRAFVHPIDLEADLEVRYSAELQGNHLAQSLWNKILDGNIYAKLNIRCQSLPNAKHNRLVHQGVPDEYFIQD